MVGMSVSQSDTSLMKGQPNIAQDKPHWDGFSLVRLIMFVIFQRTTKIRLCLLVGL